MKRIDKARPVVCQAGLPTTNRSGRCTLKFIKLTITAEKPEDWVELIVKDFGGKEVLFEHRALAMSTETFFDFTGGPIQCDKGYCTKHIKNCRVQYYT